MRRWRQAILRRRGSSTGTVDNKEKLGSAKRMYIRAVEMIRFITHSILFCLCLASASSVQADNQQAECRQEAVSQAHHAALATVISKATLIERVEAETQFVSCCVAIVRLPDFDALHLSTARPPHTCLYLKQDQPLYMRHGVLLI